MVTSEPCLITFAFPIGTVYFFSGTSPKVLCSHLCSIKITGLLSSTAEINNPFASYGVAGITTLSPGMCANQDSKLCEC